MTYGLLHSRIRKRLRREEFSSFPQLLQRARAIEDSLNEGEGVTLVSAVHGVLPSASAPPPTATVPELSGAARLSPGAPPMTQGPNDTMKTSRPVCLYCRRHGHSREQCRKLASRGESCASINFAGASCDNSEIIYSVESSKPRVQCSKLSSNSHLNAKDNSSKLPKVKYKLKLSFKNVACNNKVTLKSFNLPLVIFKLIKVYVHAALLTVVSFVLRATLLKQKQVFVKSHPQKLTLSIKIARAVLKNLRNVFAIILSTNLYQFVPGTHTILLTLHVLSF